MILFLDVTSFGTARFSSASDTITDIDSMARSHCAYGSTSVAKACPQTSSVRLALPPSVQLSRRQIFQGLGLSGLLFALPSFASDKQYLPIEQLQKVIRRSFIEDQYFTSGRLPKAVYADDAVLSDPTQSTKGIEQWSRVVPLLFDWKNSQVDLISIDTLDPHTIGIRFRLDAKFTPLFLGLKLKPFTASCTFKTNDKGLVVEQKVRAGPRRAQRVSQQMCSRWQGLIC